MKKILMLCSALFLGLAFTPIQAQDVEYGLASYYSDDFHGRKTAYGDIYNKNKLTCAHKKHPYGTKLKVSRRDNNKSVTVTVTDKGPYIKGRVVDLSRAAAIKIGLLNDGVVEVKVEVVGKSRSSQPPKELASAREDVPTTYDNQTSRRITTNNDDNNSRNERSASESASARKTSSSSKKTSSSSKDKTTPKGTSSKSRRLVGKEFQKYGLYKIVLEKPETRGYGVQVVSLYNYENVLKQVAELQEKWFENILISIENNRGRTVYKIIVGDFATEEQAKSYKSSLKRKHKIDGFVVNLSEISYN